MIGDRGCPMKSPRVLIALSLLLLAVGWSIWSRGHTFSPTEAWGRLHTFSRTETESAFLKNYTPTNVLNRFNDGQAYGHRIYVIDPTKKLFSEIFLKTCCAYLFSKQGSCDDQGLNFLPQTRDLEQLSI